MEAFRYHVYICDQKKPEGAPSCTARGCAKVIAALRREINSKNLAGEVQITTCGSLGLCERGPNMVVYPEGVWYSDVSVGDIPEIVSEHFQQGRIVRRLANADVAALKSEMESNRTKMLAAMKAQDEAGVLPDELMQTIQGFRASRIILTAVELDIFSAMGDGARAVTVAEKLKLDLRATETLLNALAALELLEKKDGIFRNTAVADRFLTRGGQDDSRMSLMHTVDLWERWSTLTDCVRKGTSVTYREFVDRPSENTEAFIAAMHKNAGFRAPMVIRTLDLGAVKKVLDVGGGSGAYSIALARANENLSVDVLDLPTVIRLTQKYIAEAGFSARVKTRAGDMRTDDLGSGYDLILISAICHMNSPEENVKLFEKSFRALVAGGKIVMQDNVMSADKTSPLSGALFAINMLVGTLSGSTYSEEEYVKWLEQAGFVNVKKVLLPGPTSLMIAER